MRVQLHQPVVFPQEHSPVLTEHEAGWAPDPVFTFWEKYHAPTRIRAQDRQSRSLVTKPIVSNMVDIGTGHVLVSQVLTFWFFRRKILI
jgi:hypothetical protein